MLFLLGEVRNLWAPTRYVLTEIAVDLTTLTTSLDNTASDIVTYQRDSTVQRKDLAQKTKDFRKLDDANKLTEIKGLLKGMNPPLNFDIPFAF